MLEYEGLKYGFLTIVVTGMYFPWFHDILNEDVEQGCGIDIIHGVLLFRQADFCGPLFKLVSSQYCHKVIVLCKGIQNIIYKNV